MNKNTAGLGFFISLNLSLIGVAPAALYLMSVPQECIFICLTEAVCFFLIFFFFGVCESLI